MIKPVQRKNLYEDISNQIINLISEGNWKVGEKIPGEIELSRLFEVSRNSIRESLKALELIGILHARSGKGTTVAESAIERINKIKLSSMPDTKSSLVEIMEARLIMEPGIVQIATQKATEEDFILLKNILDNCETAFNAKDYDFEMGFSFHEKIFEISGNSILVNIVHNLKEKQVNVRRKIFLKTLDTKVLMEELAEHKSILKLMKDRNADAAATAMKHHIEDSLNRLKHLN